MSIRELTDSQIVELLRGDSLLNRVRAVFSNAYAGIEQAGMQRRRPNPVEVRRMEFEAAQELIEVACSESVTWTQGEERAMIRYAALLSTDPALAKVESPRILEAVRRVGIPFSVPLQKKTP